MMEFVFEDEKIRAGIINLIIALISFIVGKKSNGKEKKTGEK
jgi:hypothetical protein